MAVTFFFISYPFSASNLISSQFGTDQLILSLDLNESEVAYASDKNLTEFALKINKDLSDKKNMAAVQELFYKNGYRAIKYDYQNIHKEEAWAVYDPTCITITDIQPSPSASLVHA